VPLTRVYRVVNESTRRGVRNPAERALAEGTSVGLANLTLLVARDGTERPIDDNAAPIRDRAGATVGCVLVFRDVTGRRRAEDELRRSTALLRAVSDGTPDLIFVKDRAARMVFANPAMLRVIGKTEAEVFGKTDPEWHDDPAEAEVFVANDLRIMASGEARVVDEVYSGPGGTRTYRSMKSPLRDEAGAVVGVIALTRDVTDQKRGERDLRDAEARLRQALAAARMVAWQYDPAAGTVTASDNAGEVFGLPPGTTLADIHQGIGLVHPGDAERYRATLARAVAECGSYQCEYRVVRPTDGGVVWAEERGQATAAGPGQAALVSGVTLDVTARKLAEEQFHTLADNIPQLAWMARPDGHIYWYNRRWYEYTGTTPEAQQGWDWQSVHDPAELPKVLTRWRASIASGQPFDMVFPLKGADGEFRPFLTRVMPVKDDAGRVTQWFGTNTDVSEQQALQDALREGERFTTRLLDASPSVVYVFDLAARRTAYINARVGAALGLTAEAVTAAGVGFLADRVHPDDQPGLRDHIDRVAGLPDGDLLAVEYRVRHADGGWLWFASRDAVFTRHPDGAARQVLGVATDVTERKRAETLLTVSEVRYRRLFETAKDGILILDAGAATVTDANPAVTELLGFSRAELLGKSLWQVGLVKDAAAGEAAARELRQSLYLRHDDVPVATKAGGRISVETVFNVYAEGGAAVIQCNVRDVTERKRLGDSLRRQAADLSEADRRKDEFLATLAHELRNPLAPIRNGLVLLRLTEVSPKAARALDMMDRQLRHLIRLVDDLLDVSRISRGKMNLSLGRVELGELAAAAAEDARAVVEQAGHELAVALPAEPVFVDGDPTRLAQVVTNLLSNSAKYTHRGGRVKLAVGRENGSAVVRVADDGIGIPAAMLGRVFDMFTQVDRALEKTTGGLGIGLSLVKGLVEMHGGTVEARSEGEGRGSEFVVRLPAALAAAPGPAAIEPEAAAPPARRRVLVVDDNTDAAESLGELLTLLGHEVRTAHDGEAGVEAAEAFRPDVVLMDLGMPKLNGYEAARRIRGRPWGGGAFLVALTGWGQDGDRRQSAEAGFDTHLVKPVNPAALVKLLADLPPKPA